MRLFAAVTPPREIRDRLTAAQAGLPDGKLVEWENLHLTLAFFGEIDGAKAEDLHAALDRISAPAFTVTLDGAGAFGGTNTRALYIGVRPEPALTLLHQKVAQAGRAAGAPPDAKRFTPHVTLARLRPGRAEPGRVATWLSGAGAFRADPFEVSSFRLLESRLGHAGPVYRELSRYALSGRP